MQISNSYSGLPLKLFPAVVLSGGPIRIPDSGHGWRMLDDPGLHTTFDILLLIISAACLDDFSPRGINQVDKPNCSKQVDSIKMSVCLQLSCIIQFTVTVSHATIMSLMSIPQNIYRYLQARIESIEPKFS